MTWLLALLRVPFQVHAINEGQIKEVTRLLQSEYPDWHNDKAKAVARRMRSSGMFKTQMHIDFRCDVCIEEGDRPWVGGRSRTSQPNTMLKFWQKGSRGGAKGTLPKREHPLAYSIIMILGIVGWDIILAFVGVVVYAISRQ